MKLPAKHVIYGEGSYAEKKDMIQVLLVSDHLNVVWAFPKRARRAMESLTETGLKF